MAQQPVRFKPKHGDVQKTLPLIKDPRTKDFLTDAVAAAWHGSDALAEECSQSLAAIVGDEVAVALEFSEAARNTFRALVQPYPKVRESLGERAATAKARYNGKRPFLAGYALRRAGLGLGAQLANLPPGPIRSTPDSSSVEAALSTFEADAHTIHKGVSRIAGGNIRDSLTAVLLSELAADVSRLTGQPETELTIRNSEVSAALGTALLDETGDLLVALSTNPGVSRCIGAIVATNESVRRSVERPNETGFLPDAAHRAVLDAAASFQRNAASTHLTASL